MTNLNGAAFCFLGKSGAGKGTQLELFLAELARQKYKTLPITSGDLFRNLKGTDTLVGRHVRDILGAGGLMPSWLAAFMWQRKIVEELTDSNTVIIFDGAPRRIEEARAIDDVMQWLMRKAVVPIYLDITRDEAFRRLTARAREDDTDRAIENRLTWFESEVKPIIDFYEERGRLLRIDGMGDTGQVFERLMHAVSNLS